jgi:electron transfer flavoprotein alpha subunit
MRDDKAFVLDDCTFCGACLETCRNLAIQSDIEPRTIPDFSDRKGVWIFAEQRDGRLTKVCAELLGVAQELASELEQEVAAVLIGDDVSELTGTLIENGADRVFLAEHPSLGKYRTIAYTDVMEGLIDRYKPSILLMGATHIGRDLAPRVSRRVGAGLTADCTALSIDPEEGILLQTRPAFGGNIMATIVNRYSRPQMATVRPGVMEKRPKSGSHGEIVRYDAFTGEEEIRTSVLETVREKKKGTDIAEAKVIVAGGRGVGGAEGFEMLKELARLMEGELAGTRIVVEEGMVPAANQVGQTGKTVRPEIYIACGISGAIQHRAGMMNSRYIIAINNDPGAPIFKIADWGIVGDLHEIVPELISQLSRHPS